MIIDRVSEAYSGLIDSDVMPSPVNLLSFYGCSSPVAEASSCAGFQSPWSPESDSGVSWSSSAGSPAHTDTQIHVEGFQDIQRQLSRYQGVRVKNTVKELIMQKRSNENQVHQYKTDFEFPVITTLLQSGKRLAEDNLAQCETKRPATVHNNVQFPYHSSENILKDQTLYNASADFFSNGPLSIETVKVQGSPMQICSPPPEPQEVLPSLYAPTSSPPYPSCQLSAQPMESPYTSPFQNLSPQHGFGAAQTSLPAPPVSFFQWQIQQEEEKLAGLTPADLTSRDSDGDTFLHIAVAQGRRALVYVLAKKMANIGMLDVKEHNSQSAFQVSVAANQHLIAQDLLSLGAQVNTMDCWGRSPLHVCAEKGYALTLQAIQKHDENTSQKVNIEAVNYDGLTPLHIAVLSHNAVVQELSRAGVPQSPQTSALMQKRKLLGECINTLLLMGASYGTKDRKSGRTCVHMAAEEANVELLRLFLDQPTSLAVINVKAYNGNTALHVAAAQQGRLAQAHAVQLLMRRGADPSAKNLENEQPIQLVPEGPLGDQVRRILKGRGVPARASLL